MAVVGVLNSAVSLYYYWRIVRTMYLEDPEEGAEPIVVPAFANATLTILLAGTMIFGLYFTPLADLTSASNSMHKPVAEVVQAD